MTTGEPIWKELLGSVNAASGAARNSWLAFVSLIAYFFITITSVTHKNLLLFSAS